MNSCFAGHRLIDVFPIVLKTLLEKGERISPRGLATREIRPIIIQIDEPHERFLNLPSVNYPLIVLKQLLSISGRESPKAISYYEGARTDGSHSAAYIY